MRTFFPRKYIPLFLFILGLLCCPFFLSNALRVKTVALFSPFFGQGRGELSLDMQIQSENLLLKNEVKHLRTILVQARRSVEELIEENPKYSLPQYKSLLDQMVKALPARVIYRDPHTWGSCFWISIGKEDLEYSQRALLSKGAPVVYGKALVGLIDEVGEKRSRVRLITDSGVKPAVRVHREERGPQVSAEEIERVVLLEEDSEKREELRKGFLHRLKSQNKTLYLGKGFLEGSSSPLWRSKNYLLKGIGFNYDHEDFYGPARDLHTGRVRDEKGEPVALIQKGDLLVTTGLDGVFPEGLEVARVEVVFPLTEGGVAFELLASPIVKNLDSIQTVFIIPSNSDQPADYPL
jgi:rod shape-determining protein MreC